MLGLGTSSCQVHPLSSVLIFYSLSSCRGPTGIPRELPALYGSDSSDSSDNSEGEGGDGDG